MKFNMIFNLVLIVIYFGFSAQNSFADSVGRMDGDSVEFSATFTDGIVADLYQLLQASGKAEETDQSSLNQGCKSLSIHFTGNAGMLMVMNRNCSDRTADIMNFNSVGGIGVMNWQEMGGEDVAASVPISGPTAQNIYEFMTDISGVQTINHSDLNIVYHSFRSVSCIFDSKGGTNPYNSYFCSLWVAYAASSLTPGDDPLLLDPRLNP